MVNNAIHFPVDLEIPKSQYSKSLGLKVSIAQLISFQSWRFTVLRAINFNYQQAVELCEIQNETISRCLPAEMKSTLVQILELQSEFHFLMRHVFSQVSSPFSKVHASPSASLRSAPPPKGRIDEPNSELSDQIQEHAMIVVVDMRNVITEITEVIAQADFEIIAQLAVDRRHKAIVGRARGG